MPRDVDLTSVSATDIAIIGMAAHLPGAADLETYWANLRDGRCSIRRLSRDELLAAGEAAHLIDRPDYVPHAATLDGFADFDADFFGFSPKEAAIMDPQHRQFLEVSWQALEDAGHPPESFAGKVGVYGGCGMGSYFYFNICSNPALVEQTGMFLLRHTGNDKDFLSTRVSHIFNLTGPSVNVQTACSTSLVATHFAVQALLGGECDMALAGGVTIELPHARGYLFKEGEILSPDGQCHAFDHRAQGTVFGSGAGVVVLRRLADAVRDGDHIWAVIKGSAVNNDGAAKAGYLAPSVDGQAAAIAMAHAVADVTADSIAYVECHGTGTYLGDPIEVAALTEAFGKTTTAQDFCRIGSVKTNIGHLDTAAGVASLIKAALALHHKQMPPSLGFEKPNPVIGFDGSPFRVNDRLTDWPAGPTPRRAGVNSLGVGGTNAHLVLEEAPARAASGESDWPFQILTLSARSKTALDAQSARLAAHLRAHPDQPLADIAWTLHKGRRRFDRRRVVVAETHEQAARLLTENDPRKVFSHSVVADDPAPVFMFPGGGAQYAGMARNLYEVEPVFRDWMDRGLAILQPKLDYDIRNVWLPEPGKEDAAETRLRRPSVQLPLIMITEYALAQLWMAWGVRPTALIGHSMGENTAACLAGVMSLPDCIGLVQLRGQLFDTVAPGGMLSVALPADQLQGWLGDALDLASVNAPDLSVATGPDAALDALAARLQAAEIDCQRIAIDIAAHSRMLEPILGRFGDYLRRVKLNPPAIPLISNRTGAFITDAQATDPDYWVAHLRGTVLFHAGLTTLAQDPARIYIEVGPGRALASLAGQHGTITANQVINSLRHAADDTPDDAWFMAQLGRVWATGGRFDWAQVWGAARRNRVPLPTYAFQRKRYFIEPGLAAAPAQQWLARVADVAEWGWVPAWTPAYAACDVDGTGDLADAPRETWAIFADDAGIGAALAARLRKAGHVVTTIRPGDAFAQVRDDEVIIAPERGREGYDQLLRDLAQRGRMPTRIVHLWLVTASERHRPGSSFFHRVQEQGFWSLFYLAQALAGEAAPHITVITSDAMQLRDEPLRHPDKATVLGPVQVIPREFPGVTVNLLDLSLQDGAGALTVPVLEEVLAPPANGLAILRGGRRWNGALKRTLLSHPERSPVVQGRPVLITGGFGGIGLTLAEALIRRHGCPIVLVARAPLPDRADWDQHLRRAADVTARRIRAVKRLEAAGGRVLTLAADVSNVEDMRMARAAAQTAFGPLQGVIHAAGVIDDAPILAKTPGAIEDVFTPKVHGTQVLLDVFPDGVLDWMALFASTSTATAPAGQVDYVAANAYLNAVARSRTGGKTRVTAINWGIWSGIGMAAEAMEARVGRPPPPPEAVDLALLDQAGFDADGNRTYLARWTPNERWVLDDHRTRAGDALLPGTGYLELVAQAMVAQGEGAAFAIDDLTFLSPLRTPDGMTTQMRLTLPRSDAGYDLRVESAVDGGAFALNAEGTISLLPLARPAPLDLAAIAARLPPPIRGALKGAQEAHLAFGPRWDALRETALGQGEGLARLTLPHYGAEGMLLHPGLMDHATGWAMGLIAGYTPAHLWVPVSYDHVRVFAPLTADICSHVRSDPANRASGQTARFDVTITAPDGTVLVEVRGFAVRRLDGAIGFGAAPVARPVGPRPLSAAEERLRHNLAQGIRAAEGADAFFRALASPARQIYVTALPLPGLVAEAAADQQQATPGTAFDRPQLDGDYVAPEGEIEKRLAGFWSDLLGVAQVGALDSFFDLGGHSLIAVRLFAMVKKTFQVEFPISILFEAPTIRACAALIAAQGVSDSAGAAAPDPGVAAPARPQRRFTHLVAMHQGEGGPRAPFFLVAGMFGNVLNLRHLAHLLGADRPFYGLQARGLLGDAPPHLTMQEAARDYLAEMRQVQPHGPYMLGGFSGGGITAYEIAQMLTAQGETVSALVMLDTPLPQRRPLGRADKNMIHWLELRRQGPAYPLRWVAGKLRRDRSKQADDSGQFHDAAIEQAFYRAIADYRIQRWAGPLSLFRPPLKGYWQVAPDRWISQERAYVLPDNDWTGLAPRVEVVEVPGDHDSMVLEPNVRVLAARMRRVIEAAERAHPPRRRLEAAE